MDIETYISSGALEAYVLGIATSDEAALVECLAKTNVRVREALAQVAADTETLATLNAQPAPDLKAIIWSQLAKEKIAEKAPERQTIALPAAASTPRVLGWKMLAAAAVLLLGVSSYGYFKSREHNRQMDTLLAQAGTKMTAQEKELAEYRAKTAVLMQQGMDVIVLEGVPNHSDTKAMVFWNKKDKKVYLDAMNLPQAPAGKQYQLWAMVGGKPVSAGMYSGDVQQSLSTISTAQAFAITLEKTGGVPSPTMENLMVMGAVKG